MLLVLYQKMQPVKHIGFRSTAVEVEEQEVNVGVEFPHFLFDALGDDVVGNAGERLQTDDVFHAFLGER